MTRFDEMYQWLKSEDLYKETNQDSAPTCNGDLIFSKWGPKTHLNQQKVSQRRVPTLVDAMSRGDRRRIRATARSEVLAIKEDTVP